MIKVSMGFVLAALFCGAASAQTTTTHRSTTTAHRTTVAKPATPTVDPADNPPGVPPVEGTPKPLYALRYVDTVIGTGELSLPRKYYTVRYTGWLTDGTKFDSSYDHPGQDTFTFPYGARRVILGWDTGFEGMRVGGKRRLYIPYELAYGEDGRAPIPARANLIFDVELVSMSDSPEPAAPATPPQPSAAPRNPSGQGQPTDQTKPTSTTPPPSSNETKPQSTPNPQK